MSNRRIFYSLQIVILLASFIINTQPQLATATIHSAPAEPTPLSNPQSESPAHSQNSQNITADIANDMPTGNDFRIITDDSLGDTPAPQSDAPAPTTNILGGIPVAAPLQQGTQFQDVEPTCGVLADLAVYRAGNAPDRTLWPQEERPTSPFTDGEWWDYRLTPTSFPANTLQPRPGNPGVAAYPWDYFYQQPGGLLGGTPHPDPGATFYRIGLAPFTDGNSIDPDVPYNIGLSPILPPTLRVRFNAATSQEADGSAPLLDMRVDNSANTNFAATQGEEVVVMVYIRNNTVENSDCNMDAAAGNLVPGAVLEPSARPPNGSEVSFNVPNGSDSTSAGQPMIFNSVRLNVETRDTGNGVNVIPPITLGRNQFYSTYFKYLPGHELEEQNLRLDHVDGILWRGLDSDSPDDIVFNQTRFWGSYVALIPLTLEIPAGEDGAIPSDYFQFRLDNLDVTCTHDFTANSTNYDCVDLDSDGLPIPASGTTSFINTRNSWYVVPVVGPLIWRDGEENNPGGKTNPLDNYTPPDTDQYTGFETFQGIHVVEPSDGVDAGDTVWFVVEIKSKAGTDNPYTVAGERTSTVRTVTSPSGGELEVCENIADGATGLSGLDNKEGWYEELYIAPETGPDLALSTPLDYSFTYNAANLGSPPPNGTTVDDMRLSDGESVYCVFAVANISANDGVGNSFILNGEFNVTSYSDPDTGEAEEITTPLNVSTTIPLSSGAVSVEKRVVSPTDPDNPGVIRPVRAGDTVVYEVVVTNTGETVLTDVAIFDSLAGFRTVGDLYPTDQAGPSQPNSSTVTLQYVVQNTDPDPLVNIVTVDARIQGTQTRVSDTDTAFAEIADPELNLELEVVNANDPGAPIEPGGVARYILTYSNNSDVGFTRLEFSEIPRSAPQGQPQLRYPLLQTRVAPDNDAFSIFPGNVTARDYPFITVYDDQTDPLPTTPDPLATQIYPTAQAPFPRGFSGTVEWVYPVPDFDDIAAFPLFQKVIVEADRQGGGTIVAEATLVTNIDSPVVDLTAQLWDTDTDAPRTNQDVVRRNELVTFDLQAINRLPELDRCNVSVSSFLLDPATSTVSPLDPDIRLNWASNIERRFPAPAGPGLTTELSTTVFGDVSNNSLRPTLLVTDDLPDPFIVIFEIDGRETCPDEVLANPDDDIIENMIERVAIQIDISNININTTLDILLVESNPAPPPDFLRSQVTSTNLPGPANPAEQLEISFRADNRGPAVPEIIHWYYCLDGLPASVANSCAAITNPATIEPNAIPGAMRMMEDGEGNDLDVDPDVAFSRLFTTFPARTDTKLFQLNDILPDGAVYPNPLPVQVILVVSETGQPNDRTIIRTVTQLSLRANLLELEVSSSYPTLVEGDHRVPVNFVLRYNPQAPNAPDIGGVQVINLMEEDSINGSELPVVNPTYPDRYVNCLIGGSSAPITMTPGEIVNGQCFFNFTDDVPTQGASVQVNIGAIGQTIEADPQPTFEINWALFEVGAHLLIEKLAPETNLNENPIPYTVTITNNSYFQAVEVSEFEGFVDQLIPSPTITSYCIDSGGDLVDPTVLCSNPPHSLTEIDASHIFSNGDLIPGSPSAPSRIFSLPPASLAGNSNNTRQVSYELHPTGGNGTHEFGGFINTATITGQREYDDQQSGEDGEIDVSATASATVDMGCPLTRSVTWWPAGEPNETGEVVNPTLGRDQWFTWGEEVEVTVFYYNNSRNPIEFTQLFDGRINRIPASGSTTPIEDKVNTFVPDATDTLNGFIHSSYVTNNFSADPTILPGKTGNVAPYLSYTFNFKVRPSDLESNEVLLPILYEWDVIWEIDGLAPVSGFDGTACGSSAAGPFERPYIPLFEAASPQKIVNTQPQVVLTETADISYSYDLANTSEAIDIFVSLVEDERDIDNFRRGLAFVFDDSLDPSVTTGSGELYAHTHNPDPNNPLSVLFWDFEASDKSALHYADAPDLSVATGNTEFIFEFDRADYEPDVPESITNTMTVTFSLVDNGNLPLWLAQEPDELDRIAAVFVEQVVEISNPIVLDEVVLFPAGGEAATRPSEIQYLITITNTSDEFVGRELELTHDTFTLDICADGSFTSVSDEASCSNGLFTLSPLQSVTIEATFEVSGNFSEPTVDTLSTATGRIDILNDGIGIAFPPIEDGNSVPVATTTLSFDHNIYSDQTCSTFLHEIREPNRDRNLDEIPELSVNDEFYYGIDVFLEPNQLYTNVIFTTEFLDFETGEVSSDLGLQELVNEVIREVARNGDPATDYIYAEPAFPTDDNFTVTMRDNPTVEADEPDLGVFCIPATAAEGYPIRQRQPDPLFISTSISGINTFTGLRDLYASDFIANNQFVDHQRIDIVDPNVQLTKEIVGDTQVVAAFPGEVVRYRITIENLNGEATLYLQDVWDDHINGGQQFVDPDGGGPLLPRTIQYWDASQLPTEVTTGETPSIGTFDEGVDGLGWNWNGNSPGTIAVGSSAYFEYERPIDITDPNPLNNRAGVVGVIANDPGLGDNENVIDSTLHTLVISNSQINVFKRGNPLVTVLGRSVEYEVQLRNIGDTPVFDIVAWDDRYNLHYADQNVNELIHNSPFGNVLFQPSPGNLDLDGDGDRIDLASVNNPNGLNSVSITFTLPTQPRCVEWTNASEINEPYPFPGNNSYSCITGYDVIQSLPLLDPLVNTAYAVGDAPPIGSPQTPGSIDGATGRYVNETAIGFDREFVDLINAFLRIELIPSVDSAPIGSDVAYTIRLRNTGDSPIRIDDIVYVPTSAVPPVAVTSTIDSLTGLTYETCEYEGQNLAGASLIYYPAGSAAPSPIDPGNTSVLPPGCTATANITIQVPDVTAVGDDDFSENEYVAVVQVIGRNVGAADPGVSRDVSDITSAAIEISISGLSTTKRAWNCPLVNYNTVDITSPNTGFTIPGTSNVCATEVDTYPNAGAQQIAEAFEGQTVYFEVSIINSGSDTFNQITLLDNPLANTEVGIIPTSAVIADGSEWARIPDAQSDTGDASYEWSGGRLVIGFPEYEGYNQGPCGLDDPATSDDESYMDTGPSTCPGSVTLDPANGNYMLGYKGYGAGPFGLAESYNSSNPASDASYFFSPAERFERPTLPGAIEIPAIVYPYAVELDDTTNDPPQFINRVQVIGSIVDDDTTVNVTDESTLNIEPANLSLTLEACADIPTFDPFDNAAWNNCQDVIRPGSDVWYRYVITSNAEVGLRDILLYDDVSGQERVIATDHSCWNDGGGVSTWVLQEDLTLTDQLVEAFDPLAPNPDRTQPTAYTYPVGRLANIGDSATCILKYPNTGITGYPEITLQDNPLVNVARVEYTIDNLTPNRIEGRPATASVSVPVGEDIIVEIPACDATLEGRTGDILGPFDIVVTNINTDTEITDISVTIPLNDNSPLTIPSLAGSNSAPNNVTTLSGAQGLTVEVPFLSEPTFQRTVTVSGVLQSTPTVQVTASATCTIKRIDGDLVVNKQVNLRESVVTAPTDLGAVPPIPPVRYTITIENRDPVLPITDVVISDPLIEAAMGSAAWQQAWEDLIPGNVLPAGTTISETFEYAVTDDQDPLINTVTVTGLVNGSEPIRDTDIATVNVTDGDLYVIATAQPSRAEAGETITFSYQICNAAPSSSNRAYEIFNLNDDDPNALTDPLAPELDGTFTPTGFIIEAQTCIERSRDVPTSEADENTIIRRTIFVEGCVYDPPSFNGVATCTSVSRDDDSQTAEAEVYPVTGGIEDPLPTIAVFIDANKYGVTENEDVQFTVEVTNVNTDATARIYIAQNPELGGTPPPRSSTLGLFSTADPVTGHPLHNYLLLPGQTTSQTRTFLWQGNPNPLRESIYITYEMLDNGNIIETGTVEAELTLPVTSVEGARVLVNVFTNTRESSPTGLVTYTYEVINISNTTVYNAYLYSHNFSPAATPNSTPVFESCSAGPGMFWTYGYTTRADASATNFNVSDIANKAAVNDRAGNYLPSLFPGAPLRGTITCRIAADYSLDPRIDLNHEVAVHWDDADSSSDLLADLQGTASTRIAVVPPLAITMEGVGSGIPGGFATFRFSVENIGSVDIEDVTIAAPPPAECVDTANWTTQDGSALWTTGATIGAGQIVSAVASCALPSTILDGAPDNLATFTYGDAGTEVTVGVDNTIFDTADPITYQVNTPLRAELLLVNGDASLDYIRAGETVTFGLRYVHQGLQGQVLEGISVNFVPAFDGVNSVCGSTTAISSTGVWDGTLANPGDSVIFLCNVTTTEGDATSSPPGDGGKRLTLAATATHNIGGTSVPLPVPANPLVDALIEYIDLEIDLVSASSQTTGEYDDGDTVGLQFILTNTGSVALENFTASPSITDARTGNAVTGKSTPYLINDANPSANLLQLIEANCQLPFAVDDTCTIDLDYTLATTDPQRILLSTFVSAESATPSTLTVSDSGQFEASIRRPVIELGLPGGNCEGRSGEIECIQRGFISNPDLNSIGPNTTVTFTIPMNNTGLVEFQNIAATGTVTTGTTRQQDGIQLTSFGQQATTNLTWTVGQTTLTPGASTQATSTWNSGALALGTNVTLNMGVTMQTAAGAQFSFTGVVNFQINDPNAPTTTVDGLPLDPNATEPLIVKTASAESAFPGEEITWTITITNGSTNIMPTVRLTDSVPGNLAIVSATTTRGASIVNGQLVDITIGTLDPGEQATVTIRTTIDEATTVPSVITNVACGTREGGTEVCGEAEVAIGPGALSNPVTGFGGSITPSDPTPLQQLPFAAGIVGLFIAMLFINMGMANRQRMLLAILALIVLGVLIGGLLVIAGGGDGTQPTEQSDRDGQPPEVDPAEAFPTATPVPVEQAQVSTPTAVPTVAPEALATIASFPPTATPYIVPTPSGPRRLNIPSLDFALPFPIVELPMVNGEWDVSNLGHNIGWLDETTWFDPSWGNTVLVGHLQLSDTDPGPFSRLNRLVPGDEVQVIEGTTVRRFEVTEIFTVGPNETSVTHPTLAPTLTLMTCTNWDEARGYFSDRLVVRAQPIDDLGG